MAEKEKAKEETKETAPVVEPKPGDKEEEVKPEGEKPQPVTREEYEQLLGRLEKSDSRWETAQGIISKQKDEITTLKDNQELWKVLIGMRAQEMGVSEAEAEQDLQRKKPNFMQTAAYVERNLEAKRHREKVNTYRSTVEEDLGLNPADEDYQTIQAFVNTGNFKAADKKIAALKAKKTEQPESQKGKSGETEDERIERLAEEKLHKKLEEKGLLTPEGGEPSAASVNDGEIRKNFREHPNDPKSRQAYLDYLERTKGFKH
jgi:hypothetical protein